MATVTMAALAALAMPSCSSLTQDDAMKKATTCARDAATSEEAAVIYQRLWRGDGRDTIDKLRDTTTLLPEQKSALVQFHNDLQQCRQMMAAATSQSNTRQTVYREEFFTRGDAIYYKLVNDQIPVGLANKLTIQSNAKLQSEIMRDDPRALRPEEIQQQRNAESMLAAAEQMAMAQPPPPPPAKRKGKQKPPTPEELEQQRLATTTCTWLGNTLDCTTPR